MAPQTAERQKPRPAKNEAFEVVGKVEESNPVDGILLYMLELDNTVFYPFAVL